LSLVYLLNFTRLKFGFESFQSNLLLLKSVDDIIPSNPFDFGAFSDREKEPFNVFVNKLL